MVDGTPRVKRIAVDLHGHLVEVPAPVAEPTHAADPLTADVSHEQPAEAIPTAAHRLVAEINAALRQQVFDVPDDSGKRAYISTTSGITSHDEFKQRNGIYGLALDRRLTATR